MMESVHLLAWSTVYAGLDNLLNYFDTIYVTGTYRRVRAPAAADDDGNIPAVTMLLPHFPPHLRNTHLLTSNDRARTNNICESWNVSFKQLVGQTHPSVWTLINAVRQDHAIASTLILQDRDGNPPQKRVTKISQELQTRLRKLCQAFADGKKEVTDFVL